MNLDPLKTELAKSDYDALIAAGDHSGLAARLNAKTVSLLRPVSSASLLAWSAQNNRFRKIEAMLGALVRFDQEQAGRSCGNSDAYQFDPERVSRRGISHLELHIDRSVDMDAPLFERGSSAFLYPSPCERGSDGIFDVRTSDRSV